MSATTTPWPDPRYVCTARRRSCILFCLNRQPPFLDLKYYTRLELTGRREIYRNPIFRLSYNITTLSDPRNYTSNNVCLWVLRRFRESSVTTINAISIFTSKPSSQVVLTYGDRNTQKLPMKNESMIHYSIIGHTLRSGVCRRHRRMRFSGRTQSSSAVSTNIYIYIYKFFLTNTYPFKVLTYDL